MIYTEIETHRASIRERVDVVRLIWSAADDPDIERRVRRRMRRMALVIYLRPSARVSSYLVAK